MQNSPKAPQSFFEKKKRILDQLAVPDASYTDASPKGSVDAAIRPLIAEINAVEGFVTTSSCAGRVSVFLEGRKAPAAREESQQEKGENQGKQGQIASSGGKGGGGKWLYVSHEPVTGEEETERLWEGLSEPEKEMDDEAGRRFIHFKFEPMVGDGLPSFAL
jgi:tRNA wybutosine-synthesizing protein 3